MPIRTLADVGGGGGGAQSSPSVRSSAVEASNKTSTSGSKRPNSPPNLSFLTCVIPNLPQSPQANELLLRIVREFQPVITRRKYNVVSISELCCCGDGLDAAPTKNGRKRRPRRRMANNIWGYNQTSFRGGGRKSHTIHLRLRHPTDHTRFLLYEDVAGTLAHELAHCEHGPHNQHFYKLMDEILDEHAALMASGLRASDGGPMMAFGGEGNRLGAAASGHRLGGGGKGQSRLVTGRPLGGDSMFTAWMTPAEAAVAAAEARRRQQQLRLRGDRCCRPCTIEISDDDDDDDEREDDELSATKNPSKRSKSEEVTSSNAENEPNNACIDLTGEDDAKVAADWACQACTFRNRGAALVCEICSTERARAD